MPLKQIAAHLRGCYPAEGCGLVLADAHGALSFAPIANIAGTAEARATSNRTGRDGYVMEPKALLTVLDSAERAGGRLYAIVHSHPDVGAYFSRKTGRWRWAAATSPSGRMSGIWSFRSVPELSTRHDSILGTP